MLDERISLLQYRSPTTMYNDYSINESLFHWQSQSTTAENSGLLTKCLFIYFEEKNGSKKDAHRRHPIHLIILFKFKAVAERRQWSSAASKPRRKTRVKLCPHFWAANVPSHQICRLRSASR